MFPYRISIEWSAEDKVYIARVPALSGVAAHGSTMEAAAHEARIASEGVIAEMKRDGEKIPGPDLIGAEFSGNIRLRLPKSLHRRLAERAADEGVSLNQMMLTLLSSDAPPPPAAKAGEKASKNFKVLDKKTPFAAPRAKRSRATEREHRR